MFATKLKEYEDKLREQGMEQGLEQGLALGREQGIELGLIQGERRMVVETVRRMKAEGLDSALIRRILDLSAKELHELLTYMETIVLLTESKTMILIGLMEHDRQMRAQGFQQAREYGLVKGREQGREQGIEQGERLKAVETARKMKAEGLDSALIRRIIDLSEKDPDEL